MHANAPADAAPRGAASVRRRLRSRPATRESRVRFTSRPALLRGLARARREPWIAACHADWSRLELVIHMGGSGASSASGAGGASGAGRPVTPRPRPRWLRLIPGGRARA